MQLTLWKEQTIKPRKQRKKNYRPRIAQIPYSITGGNDCDIIGHTLNAWDLLGCSTCIDCKARVYCPLCTKTHPQDAHAIPIFCPMHEESKVRL